PRRPRSSGGEPGPHRPQRGHQPVRRARAVGRCRGTDGLRATVDLLRPAVAYLLGYPPEGVDEDPRRQLRPAVPAGRWRRRAAATEPARVGAGTASRPAAAALAP